MPRTNELFFINLLIVITLLNIYDFYNDYGEYQDGDYGIFNLVLEAFVILASTLGIAFLMRVIQQRGREVDTLRQQLKTTRKDLSETNDKMRQASRQYSEVIQEQLITWDFTPSEKEIAMLLLKGLSFDEIASVRDSREKTVRQQATAIYRKSGLNGRHEFAAWFFEDFLH
ncbi:MAG: helix-turn-helix transcriptional regulator [Candidatus Thiothrix putei]|uniref:Helix-turn-helix transcriptional regulator n=1 Tax=Candidatus Thiothrix putei TaxID=3080811 RepID=A0AA95HF67_9GAMM|nr:MAG: helix-turn-helix transcriptional regulator [Candidatus Thiothrix putei]